VGLLLLTVLVAIAVDPDGPGAAKVVAVNASSNGTGEFWARAGAAAIPPTIKTPNKARDSEKALLISAPVL
jgi:hypothetical protein